MSAIVGIYRRDGSPVTEPELARMTSAVAHRGPDGISIWREGSIGLGHCMLWTTPESLHEKLPSRRAESQLAITSDARIDNRSELIESLSVDEEQISDSELILLAYEKWGAQCCEKLVGDFAFAIWDGRTRQLFCARDHFGVKPFYYHSSGRFFAFGTEIKALFALPDIPRRLNELRVAEHLSGFIEDKEITFYKDVQRLPPGHSMTVDRKGLKLSRYWSLDTDREIRMKSDGEYAQALRELFTEAVRCRLRSAFPVGSMLSGGLDSSSITCVARKLLDENGGGRLHTFSAVFDKVVECDESVFIDAVLAENKVYSHHFHADQQSPLADLDRVLWHLDEVAAASNLNIQWGIYGGAAKENGVRVILDGFDGDTTISHGTGYLMELAQSRRWATLIKEARGYAKHFDNLSSWHVVLSTIEHHGLGPGARRVVRVARRISKGLNSRRKRWLKYPGEHRASDFINSEFLFKVGFEEHCKSLRMRKNQGPVRSERENHCKRLSDPGMVNALELLNNAAGAFSVETRFPFWDKRLAEFCLALPAEQKLSDGWNRMVMRRAMEDILPREVQWRGGKTDMSPSIKYGMWAFERKRLDDAFHRNSEIIEPYVRIGAVRDSYERFVNQDANESDVFTIWKSLSLALWLQHVRLVG